jgi:hypothetical protein
MRLRLRVALAAAALLLPAALLLGGEVPADAAARASVYVYSPASSTVRLRVSEGPGAECDSEQNSMRFDGEIHAGETLRVPIYGPCVCASSTSTSFPDSDWSTGRLYCPAGNLPIGRRPVAPRDFTIQLDGR